MFNPKFPYGWREWAKDALGALFLFGSFLALYIIGALLW
tara:strand:+ start:796 stop:912 length:117 start_codon:yes stop_codon:yes gene_type:complete